jgi:prolyl 4-hydroxylase
MTATSSSSSSMLRRHTPFILSMLFASFCLLFCIQLLQNRHDNSNYYPFVQGDTTTTTTSGPTSSSVRIDGSGSYWSSDRFQYQKDSPTNTAASPVSSNRRPTITTTTQPEVVIVYIDDDIPYDQLDMAMIVHECVNLRIDCDRYAAAGGCTSDPLWMLPHCPVSCNVCQGNHNHNHHNHDDDELGMDHSPSFTYPPIRHVPIHQAFGFREFKYTSQPVQNGVRLDAYGIVPPQRMVDGYEATIQQTIKDVTKYLKRIVDQEDLYQPVRTLCRTMVQHTDCAYWASSTSETDMCTTSWNFMKENGCALFCQYCEVLHIESSCPIDINEKNAWYPPNDLNNMFESMLQQFNSTYNITVLSRPSMEGISADNDADHDSMDQTLRTINSVDGPWVVQIDNFLSVTEAETLIQLGAESGYTRSTEVGAENEMGIAANVVSQHRTSTNTFCESDACSSHPVVLALYERINNITSLPVDRSESLQLLKYDVGQYYKIHHDYIDGEIRRQAGVRILTVFLYLNTMEDDESGGGTNFPKLNITVQPMIGRAVIWPNVLNDAPNLHDDRTYHQALVVKKGMKYGANAWYHQRAVTCEEEE